MDVTLIKNAIKRLRNLERYNKLKLTDETLRELDRWIRRMIYSEELTESERQHLQDFYIATLRRKTCEEFFNAHVAGKPLKLTLSNRNIAPSIAKIATTT